METIQIQKPRFEVQARMLETTTFRQMTGYHTDYRNRRCALMVIAEADEEEFNALPDSIKWEIFKMNDTYGKTFGEIAAWLRAQK